MPTEWVTVYPPFDAPPAVVNRKAYDDHLKANGFRLSPPKKQDKKKETE
jgi:hypothetical protein